MNDIFSSSVYRRVVSKCAVENESQCHYHHHHYHYYDDHMFAPQVVRQCELSRGVQFWRKCREKQGRRWEGRWGAGDHIWACEMVTDDWEIFDDETLLDRVPFTFETISFAVDDFWRERQARNTLLRSLKLGSTAMKRLPSDLVYTQQDKGSCGLHEFKEAMVIRTATYVTGMLHNDTDKESHTFSKIPLTISSNYSHSTKRVSFNRQHEGLYQQRRTVRLTMDSGWSSGKREHQTSTYQEIRTGTNRLQTTIQSNPEWNQHMKNPWRVDRSLEWFSLQVRGGTLHTKSVISSLYNTETDTKCETCGKEDTILHVLVECTQAKNARVTLTKKILKNIYDAVGPIHNMDLWFTNATLRGGWTWQVGI